MPYPEIKAICDPIETISVLIETLPKIASTLDLKEGSYVVLGDFAIAVRDGIINDHCSEAELDSVFGFLNRLGASDHIEVKNQLVVGVLEILIDSPESIAACRQRLSGDAASLFERTLKGWQHLEDSS